jgi:hypothetical protein
LIQSEIDKATIIDVFVNFIHCEEINNDLEIKKKTVKIILTSNTFNEQPTPDIKNLVV